MGTWLQQEIARFQLLSAMPFLVSWASFFGVALISYVWQYNKLRPHMSFKAFVRFSLPFDKWTSRSSGIDFALFVVYRLLLPLLAPLSTLISLGVGGLVLGLMQAALPAYQPGSITTWGLIVSAIVIFLVTDFANFFSHYLQHKVPALWEVHKVHHSATFLTPMTSYRVHPLSDQFDTLFSAALAGIPLGLMAGSFGLPLSYIIALRFQTRLIGITFGLDALRHSHFPVSFGWFDRLFISPAMHQLHHSTDPKHWDKNMGTRLTLWDWLFKTTVLPQKGESLSFGLGQGPVEDAEQEKVYNVTFLPVLRMIEATFKPLMGKKRGILRIDSDEAA